MDPIKLPKGYPEKVILTIPGDPKADLHTTRVNDPELGKECFESYWEMSPEERAALLKGHPLLLRVYGAAHPPVRVLVSASPPPAKDETWRLPKVPPRTKGDDANCQLCALKGRKRKSAIWLHTARQFYWCAENGINPDSPAGCPNVGLCKKCYVHVDDESEKHEAALKNRAHIRMAQFGGGFFEITTPPPEAN